MKKLVLVMTAGLLWAAPANAKEVLGAQLCGPSGCATEHANLLLAGPGGPFAGELVAPARPGDWYRGYLLAGDNGKVAGKLLFYYVPGARQVVQPGRYGQTTSWTEPHGKLATVLERLAARVKPYRTLHLTFVTVDGTRVRDPQSYLRLWTVGTKAHSFPEALDERQIAFTSDPTTPWSDGNYVVVYPKARLLLRDGQLVSLSKQVAERVARGDSLDTGSSRPWLWALVALPVAAAGGLRLRRLGGR